MCSENSTIGYYNISSEEILQSLCRRLKGKPLGPPPVRQDTSTASTGTQPPKVFISYSHDSHEHADRVLAFADSLVRYGIEVILDQYDPQPEDGWPLWMENHLDESAFVLLVCTETYLRRVRGQETPGTGLGVRWEGKLVYNRIYRDQPQGSRFIPILLEGGDPGHIPTPVQGHTRYEIRTFDFSDPGYERLYRHLTDQPLTPRPERGGLVILPPHPRGTPASPP